MILYQMKYIVTWHIVEYIVTWQIVCWTGQRNTLSSSAPVTDSGTWFFGLVRAIHYIFMCIENLHEPGKIHLFAAEQQQQMRILYQVK